MIKTHNLTQALHTSNIKKLKDVWLDIAYATNIRVAFTKSVIPEWYFLHTYAFAFSIVVHGFWI